MYSKLALISLTLFLINIRAAYSQNIYYQNGAGDIYNSQTYEEHKGTTLKNEREINRDYVLYEDLYLVYQSKDSVVYYYQWATTFKSLRRSFKASRKIQNSLINTPFPFAAFDLEDNFSQDSLDNKPTVISLWYVNCRPCIEEIPILNRLASQFRDSVNFLSITFSNQKKVEKLLSKRPFYFKHFTDVKKLKKDYKFLPYPTTLVLDREGKIVWNSGGIPYQKNAEGQYEFTGFLKIEQVLHSLL